jgi:large subunit ribosomal protein L24
MKLRKNDEVIVLKGKEKGKTGKILKVLTKEERVLIAGINIIKKHVKPTQTDPEGGIQEKEAPIHISNVAYYIKGKMGGPSKIGYKYDDKGKKKR